MIKVKRYKRDENGCLIKPSSDWFSRARSATQSAEREGKHHKADRGIYAADEVRIALEKLFHDKCAYCEWQPTGGSDWDVEHFRPAGAVAERKDHPGYYWLAYNWKNLYLSCTHCNQSRKDKPRWDDLRRLPASGKLHRFPVEESSRAMSHRDNVNTEKTLLLDPCAVDPETYFGYDPHGQIIALRVADESAKKTIEILHLTRKRLKDLRRVRVQLAVKIMRMKKRAATRSEADAVRDFSELLDEMMADESPFAGPARFVVKNESIFLQASVTAR